MILAFIVTGGGFERWVEAGEALNKLPSLDQALAMAARHNSKGEISKSEAVFEVKRNYDLVLARREQLEISREVQKHFEKALTQAEKKFEEGEGDVSQSAITKLKLGLAGTLNDISQFNSDIALAQLHLEKYLGIRWAGKVDISGPKFRPVDFPHKSVVDYVKSNSSLLSTKPKAGLFNLKVAIIEVNRARNLLELARTNRKMTRALLVTEVANYDFGIGNEADLFEALIIYTRVLVGYYDAIYEFNLSVYRFTRIDGQP